MSHHTNRPHRLNFQKITKSPKLRREIQGKPKGEVMSAEAIDQPRARISVISTGLALFSMFFGAGNLIFPLIVGRLAGTETPYAIIGLGLSAVVFPFLGLIAMMLYSGNITLFLSRLGKWPAFALLLILQLSQGPLGAMPRLVTLMHASIKVYLPGLSLFVFSLLICAGIFFLVIRPQRIIRLLGTVLTPLLLLTLAILIIVGWIGAPEAQAVAEGSSYHLFLGLKMGYQTTDLIAALLFATVILPHLSQGTNDPKVIRRRMTYASLIASGLLMVTYIGLCWLSAHHSWTFGAVAPEDLLLKIAVQVLGPWGGVVSSAAVFLACLTTAISLAAVFAGYLQTDLLKGRIKSGASLALTLGFTAALANLGFSGIVKLWGPLLEALYPALIVLCLMNIAHSLYRTTPIAAPVFFTLGFGLGGCCF
jgi:LIVCS family branched-chain amino acid:cation transporter